MVVVYNCEQYGTIGAMMKEEAMFSICLPPLIDREFEEYLSVDKDRCRCKMIKKLKR